MRLRCRFQVVVLHFITLVCVARKVLKLRLAMGKELPLGISGLVRKRLAWDESLGDQSTVANVAYQISQERRKRGLPGTENDDWVTAERVVQDRFAKELVKH